MTESVTSLDLSLKLKEAGARQCPEMGTLHYAMKNKTDSRSTDYAGPMLIHISEGKPEPAYVPDHLARAFTVGEMLAEFDAQGWHYDAGKEYEDGTTNVDGIQLDPGSFYACTLWHQDSNEKRDMFGCSSDSLIAAVGLAFAALLERETPTPAA